MFCPDLSSSFAFASGRTPPEAALEARDPEAGEGARGALEPLSPPADRPRCCELALESDPDPESFFPPCFPFALALGLTSPAGVADRFGVALAFALALGLAVEVCGADPLGSGFLSLSFAACGKSSTCSNTHLSPNRQGCWLLCHQQCSFFSCSLVRPSP